MALTDWPVLEWKSGLPFADRLQQRYTVIGAAAADGSFSRPAVYQLLLLLFLFPFPLFFCMCVQTEGWRVSEEQSLC